MTNDKQVDYFTLETQRLRLRILTLQDAGHIYQHFADEEITRFMDIEPCRSMEEAEEIIQFHLDDAGCRWGVFDKEQPTLIGTCGFHYLRKTDSGLIAEMGYDLAKSYWGKGYMLEAIQAIIHFGFEKMELTKIDATVEPENIRSIHLMEKLGFEREPELKDNLVYFYKSGPEQPLK